MNVTFNTEDVTVYIAGAGSGKTTALMGELTSMLKEYRPDEIAFTTFTRKGVLTGIERALNTNASLNPEDLIYFQTLHRMCFHESKLKRKNIIEPRDIVKFNRLLGFNLSASAMANTFGNHTEDDKMLQRYDAIRSEADTGIFIHSMYDEERYNRLVNAYEVFKKENDLVDFYDCLLRYREIGKPLPVAAFFLDEAQDVTPLQWEVVQMASRNAEKIRIGGDPAQSIFSYQGAVPATLISLAKRHTTVELNSTYRLPEKICKVADSIIEIMEQKLPRKHIAIKKEKGVVQEIADRELLARIIKKDFGANGMKEYRWFCLFRTNCHIHDMAALLEQHCIPYHTAKGFVINDRDINKIKRYMKYREVGYGTPESKANFMEEHGIEDIYADFTESSLIPSERRYIYSDYIDKYGLETLAKMVYAAPYCLLTTTYKVKGGEADNVAVFMDATKQVSENTMVDLDGELRVFYTACTRSKEKLYIVQPENKYNLLSLWEAVVENMGGKI